MDREIRVKGETRGAPPRFDAGSVRNAEWFALLARTSAPCFNYLTKRQVLIRRFSQTEVLKPSVSF